MYWKDAKCVLLDSCFQNSIFSPESLNLSLEAEAHRLSSLK